MKTNIESFKAITLGESDSIAVLNVAATRAQLFANKKRVEDEIAKYETRAQALFKEVEKRHNLPDGSLSEVGIKPDKDGKVVFFDPDEPPPKPYFAPTIKTPIPIIGA